MVENKFQILRLETSPCSGRHRESMKITGKMDWNCCNWMSISDYYLRKWPAPDCPLNPLQRVALHTRHAGRVLPRLAQDSVTRRGLRIEDDHSRWAASTTARSVFRQKGTGFAGLDRGSCSLSCHRPMRWIHSGSASSCQRLWNVPARLGHHSPHSLQPQFVIGLQPLDGSYLLFPPAICSQTVTKLLDSMKVHSGPYKPPPPLTSPNLPGRAARLPNCAKFVYWMSTKNIHTWKLFTP